MSNDEGLTDADDPDVLAEREGDVPPETSPEAPEADVAEQRADVVRDEGGSAEMPAESDPQDAVDQRRPAPADEDDYR